MTGGAGRPNRPGAPPRRAPPPSSGFAVAGRQRGGAGGTPRAIRGGQLSKSVAKAPRAGIGREKNRGISTILLRRPGAIRAFATDLDKPRRHGLRRGRPRRAPRRPGGPLTTGRGPPGRHAPGRTTATRSSRSDGAHGSAARPARTRAPAPPVRPGPPVNAPRRARSSLDPRERTSSRRSRGSSDVLAGQVTISRTAAPD